MAKKQKNTAKRPFKERDLIRIGAIALDNLYKKPNYIRNLSNIVGCEWVHMANVMNKLEDAGLIKKERNGRKTFLILTEKGENIALSVKKIRHDLK